MPRFSHQGMRGPIGAENQTDELSHAGAASLNEDYAQSLAMEQHRVSQQYEQMHYELSLARIRSEAARDQAKAEHQMKYEALMEQAIPKLYAIDPASKDAHAQLAEIAKEYPQLGGSKEFMSHMAGYRGLIEGARKMSEGQDFKSDSQKERESFQTQLAAQRSADIADRQQERMAHQDELAKAKAPSAAIQTRYQKSVNDAANYQKELDQTQKYIDEQQSKGQNIDDVSQKNLTNMLRSRDSLQRNIDRATATKDALELVHPELNAAAKPGTAADVGTPKTEPADTATGGADASTATNPEDQTTQAPAAKTAPPSGSSGETLPAPAAGAAAEIPPPATLNQPPAKSGNAEWDALTQTMHDSDASAQSARARRDAALETLRTAKFADFANPFSSKISDAAKEHEEASDLVDQHEAAYMDALHKRGELLAKRAGDDATTAEVPVVEGAPVNPNLAPSTGAQAAPAETGAPAADVPAPAIPQAHIDALIANPDKAADFDAKYGKDASTQYLSE